LDRSGERSPSSAAGHPEADRLKALSEPHRLRMLEHLAAEPDAPRSVGALAEALGVPRTRLYHHVKVLLRHDLVEVAQQRPVRGGTEAAYRITPDGLEATAALARPAIAGPTEPGCGAEAPPTQLFLSPPRASQAVVSPARRRRRAGPPVHRPKEAVMGRSPWLEVVAAGLAMVVGLFAFGFNGGGFAGLRGNDAPLGAGVAVEEVEAYAGPAEPDDAWFEVQRAGGPGKLLDQGKIVRAQQQARQLVADERAATPASAPRQLRGRWEHHGPTNMGGRIVDLVVDIDDPTVLYAASASGGMWKGVASTDGPGVRMEYLWDDAFPQSLGSIAQGPDGRLWAGTGEHNPGGGSTTFPGNGVYVSSDRGQSWRNVGLRDSATTGEIHVRPDDPNTIFVAASGSLFKPGGERGVYRSTNGGASWKLVLPPATPFTGGIDLAINPENPDRIYAAMWDHRREPHIRTYGGVGSGLFRSDDGGDTWERLENVTSLTPGDPTGLVSDGSLGRVGVALAPSNPDRVYVITGQTFGGNKGFYVSDDGGDSFRTGVYPGQQGGFQWWFGRIFVDPDDADHVHVAGVSPRRSTNGGTTWTTIGGLHADSHAQAWARHDGAPNRVYHGDDGGIYRTDSATFASNQWTRATNQLYMQIYMMDVGEQQPDRVVAGFQDRGSWRSWQGQNTGSPNTWTSYNGGDGLHTLISPDNNNLYYGCSQYGSCVRRVDGPAPVGNATISTGTISQRRNWNTPVVIDPNNPEILYYAGNHVNRSTARGTGWTNLSDGVDLTGDWTTHGGEFDPAYGTRWGTSSALAVSKSHPNTLYVGTDTGRLWKTEDLGENWVEFTGKGLPDRWVTRVDIDPDDHKTVYATFSGYRNGEDAAHVFKTTNGGETWEDVSGNLPNAPVNDIVIDKANSTVYVGTDVGVFYLKNAKKNWKPVGGQALPLVPVLDIRLHSPSNTLYASTFGRGVFKIDLSA
jgi:DNA-binding transcriptional ArsR family regulator